MQSLRVKVYLDEDLKRIITLASYLRVMAGVAAAAHDIEAAHVLCEEDIEYQLMDLVKLRPGAYGSAEELIGKVLNDPALMQSLASAPKPDDGGDAEQTETSEES